MLEEWIVGELTFHTATLQISLVQSSSWFLMYFCHLSSICVYLCLLCSDLLGLP